MRILNHLQHKMGMRMVDKEELQISVQIGDRIKPNTTLVQIGNSDGNPIDSVKL